MKKWVGYNPAMASSQTRPLRLWWSGAALIAVSFLLLLVQVWPIPMQDESFIVQSTQLQRTYRLDMQYPSRAVAGDPFPVVVKLSSAGPEIAELPSAMGAMQLASDSLAFDPDGVISAPFPTSKTITFSWQTVPRQTGDIKMTLFFSRQSLDPAAGKLVEQPAWAKTFPVSVQPGLGAWKNPALFFSACGILLGFLMMLISTLPPRRRIA
jgi:hypothetical protein